MSSDKILVVGAGPAGLRAAITLADNGQRVVVAEQAAGIGGAVYAMLRGVDRSGKGGAIPPEAQALASDLAARRGMIDIRCSTSFAGLDYTGAALLVGRNGAIFRPKAVIFATGARELVRPRPGWIGPRVTTAGALQVELKTTGTVGQSRIVLAGSGPLLYAIGAQMARAGRPPLAILDEAFPFRHPFAAMGLPVAILREAAGYVASLWLARVRILSGVTVERIDHAGEALEIRTSHKGRFQTITADRLALHDGLARNDYGIPESAAVPIALAGDCREVLGRWAAESDGRRAARDILGALGSTRTDKPSASLAGYASAQKRLAVMFASDQQDHLKALPEDTVLCRCENRTLGDLRCATADHATPRSLRLNGRYGMGPCQGRFCLDWVEKLAGEPFGTQSTRGNRWPLRPISVADILAADPLSPNPPSNTK